MKKILNFFKKRILRFLELDHVTYCGVDFGMENSEIMIITVRHNGKIELIADYTNKHQPYVEIIKIVNGLIKQYNIAPENICVDRPMFLNHY